MTKTYIDRSADIDKFIKANELEKANAEIQLAKLQAQHEFIDASFAMKQLRHQQKRVDSAQP